MLKRIQNNWNSLTAETTKWYSLLRKQLVSFLFSCVCLVTQSCPTLYDPMEYTVHGILQAKILEWLALTVSRGFSQPRDRTQVSHIAGRFFAIWATRESHWYNEGEIFPALIFGSHLILHWELNDFSCKAEKHLLEHWKASCNKPSLE